VYTPIWFWFFWADALDSVDLEQLKIQNSQYNSKIKEKNDELLKLKIVTGKTIQNLNRAKVTILQLFFLRKVKNTVGGV
jgi:hypothetical protein